MIFFLMNPFIVGYSDLVLEVTKAQQRRMHFRLQWIKIKGYLRYLE